MSKEKAVYKVIAQNKRARFNYEILETLEVGIVLNGNEVKSVRAGKVTLQDSFARIDNNELWLHNCHISPYSQANTFYKIDPTRTRKLLAHKKQIKKWLGKTEEKGLTITVTRLFLKGQYVKCEVALARAKKLHDKREKLKEKDVKRELQRKFK